MPMNDTTMEQATDFRHVPPSHGTPPKRNYRGKATVNGYATKKNFSSDNGFTIEIFSKQGSKETLAFTVVAGDVELGKRSIQIFEGVVADSNLVVEFTDNVWHSHSIEEASPDSRTTNPLSDLLE